MVAMRGLLLLLLTMTMTSIPAHATTLHLCPRDAAPAQAPFADIAGANGMPLRWTADDQAEHAGCASVALPAGARVETLFPLAPGEQIEHTILLHGRVREGRFAVSEHLLPSSRPGIQRRGLMPLHARLLERMTARAFGVEERVQARLEGGRLQVTCGAGMHPAGVLLSGPWTLPRARLRVAAAYAGDAGFALQVADSAYAGRDTALDLGELPARASGAAAAPLRLALPEGLDRASWQHFVLQCPMRGASLALDSLAIEPDPATGAKPAARSSWVWHAADWREHGAGLLAWAAAHAVRELFITVPLKDGEVRDPAALAAFVRAAGARGVRVLSVDGDPHMVLPDSQAALARMVRAYAAYNAGVAPAARLAGLQFDVEPYLLPAYGSGGIDWDARYLAMARTLRKAAGSLRLELVVPFWWDGKTALLDGLAPLVDGLTVMDYRTDRQQITGFAIPFLDWGARHGKRVRIALEAGEVAPETQRRYVRAAAGEAGDLLRVEIDGSATTFHEDKAALLRLLPDLEADFSAWDDAFGGMALHELR